MNSFRCSLLLAILSVSGSALGGPAEERGRALVEKGGCIACHGVGLSSPTDPFTPRLAGQYPDYLAAALRAYATVGNDRVGRQHAVMSALMKNYTTSDLEDMASYISGLPGQLRVASQSGVRR